jgi:hypothetical protein
MELQLCANNLGNYACEVVILRTGDELVEPQLKCPNIPVAVRLYYARILGGGNIPTIMRHDSQVQCKHGVPAEDPPKRRDKLPSRLTGHGSCRLPQAYPPHMHVGNAMGTMRAEDNKHAMLLRLDVNETPPHQVLLDLAGVSSLRSVGDALATTDDDTLVYWLVFEEGSSQRTQQ